jgi:hypothetical protein
MKRLKAGILLLDKIFISKEKGRPLIIRKRRALDSLRNRGQLPTGTRLTARTKGRLGKSIKCENDELL